MSMFSTSRRLLLSPFSNGFPQATRQITTPAVVAPSRFSSRRYSSSSSSSNSRNGGILGRTQSFRRKAKTLDTSAPAVVVAQSPRNNVQDKIKTSKPAERVALPFVPTTGHLERADVAVSTFFAEHRPVSIVCPVPGAYTEDAFMSIFEMKQGKHTSTEGIGGEEDLSYISSMPAVSPSLMRHIAHSPIQLPSHILQSRFQHFSPPPPPQPIPTWNKMFNLDQQKSLSLEESIYPEHAARAPARKHAPRRGHIIMITHSKTADGALEVMARIKPEVTLQPFLKRMQLRRKAYVERIKAEKMHTLSVRRQRKLKMKKHKYKKLRRKTRAERRRLDKG